LGFELETQNYKLKTCLMAINKNHEFEDLDGIKCAIVEKNASKERVDFLKQILEYNHYSVVAVPTPPPKPVPQPAVKPAAAIAPGAESKAETAVATPEAPPPPPLPETYTVGVTDVSFNPINAIFGRLLKAPGGHIVTLAYWQQKEKESHDEVPYFNVK
jgi:hypothetical protein